MSDKRIIHPVRGFFFVIKQLFFIACVLIAAFAVVGYAAGWIEFHRDGQHDKATIEIQTGKVKHSVEQSVEKGKELVEDAGDKLQSITSGDSAITPEKKSEPATSDNGPMPSKSDSTDETGGT